MPTKESVVNIYIYIYIISSLLYWSRDWVSLSTRIQSSDEIQELMDEENNY